MRDLLHKCPGLIRARIIGHTLLSFASGRPSADEAIVRFLISAGSDLESLDWNRLTALDNAVARGRIDIVNVLHDAGATVWTDDNGTDRRPLISAIANAPNSLEMVKLLIEYGVDPHKMYMNTLSGKPVPMNALLWAEAYGKTDVAEYLRSLGCVLPAQTSDAATGGNPEVDHDPVAAYFASQFGRVHELSLVEIVPSGISVAIRVVPPGSQNPALTLFTSGVSKHAMNVPAGEHTYQYAELFIQLPGDWKYKEIGSPEWGWPVHWLQKLAQYPFQSQTWLGGPVSVIDNDPPYQPLAPNVRFTSLLLLAERDCTDTDGRLIQLYRLTPLYPEERALERREGIAALLQAFDREDVPFIVDPNRKNVAL